MSLLIVATTLVCSIFIRKLLNLLHVKIDLYDSIIISSTTVFICKICIPDFSPYYYLDSFVTQPWHNSTYVVMRIFGLLAVYYFFRIQKNYLHVSKFNVDYLFFTLSLIAVNFSKPNFIIGFAPIMLICLIYDFIKTKGKSFKNAFIFGVCVLIACSFLIIQYTELFPSDGDSQMVLSLSNAINYFKTNIKYPLYFVLNYMFAIYVSFLVYKNKKRLDKYSKRVLIQTWMMQALSFIEWLFLIEIGYRSDDNNFIWGLQFFSYLLFVVCICMLIKMKNEKHITESEYTVSKCIYITHIIFGICYFACLFFGYWPFSF